MFKFSRKARNAEAAELAAEIAELHALAETARALTDSISAYTTAMQAKRDAEARRVARTQTEAEILEEARALRDAGDPYWDWKL